MAAALAQNLANKVASAAQSIVPAKPGSKLPSYPLKKNNPDTVVNLAESKGKILIVGVPGAFTPPCSSQVPGYIQDYEKFAAKGVHHIYVVPINDIFTVNAWKEKLGKDSRVEFLADDTGNFTRSAGLTFDATGLLGGERAQRYVIVAQDGVVQSLVKEDEAPSVTVTASDKVLASL